MKQTELQRQRLRGSAKKAAILLTIGIGYLLFTRIVGWGIPCAFRSVTGLYCPGCGISRMFIALSRLDFGAALRYNALVLVMLLPAILFGLRHWLRYIKTGKSDTDKLENVLLLLCGILTIAFWILRNLPQFSILAP